MSKRPISSVKKEQAWRHAAAHLTAILQDKGDENYASDDEEVWTHIEKSVIPSLERRAEIIARNRRRDR